MKNATMFTVGLLMIAMLVGFGASAAAPADFEYDPHIEEEAKGQFMSKDGGPSYHPMFDPPLNYADSFGGWIADCTCPPNVGPGNLI
jgi:hypothetical protein